MSNTKQKTNWDLAEDLCSVEDSVRIFLEIISDTVSQSNLGSEVPWNQAQERIIVLTEHAQKELKKVSVMASKLREDTHA